MLIYLRETFVYWWVVANHFINYLYGTRKRYREAVVGVVSSLAALSASSLPGMSK